MTEETAAVIAVGGTVVPGPWVPSPAPVIDADGWHVPGPVDRPDVAGEPLAPWERAVERRPVLAPWLTDPAARRAAVVWSARAVLHPVAFHGIRVPLYVTRLAARAPWGAARLVRAVARWVADADTRALIAGTVAAGADGSTAYLALVRERDAKVKRRAWLAAVPTGMLALGETVAWFVEPSAFWASVAAGVVALGVAGRRRDRPIVSSRLTSSGAPPRLTSDAVVRALASAGITGMTPKAAETIDFIAPGIGRDGPGWRVELDLPHGVTVAHVLDARERLAAGLRRPLGAVWPEGRPDVHPGRLVLWVGDRDLSAAPAPPWPLARSGTVDLFAPASVPWGVDPRGRPVAVGLFENNILIGAIPGAGKTAALRPLVLAAGLDPLAQVWVFNLKGNRDLAAAELFAARYVSNAGPIGVQAALQGLRDLKAEIVRRTEVMAGIPETAAPDGSVTRALAGRAELGLHPLVMVVDEAQVLFTDAECGKEAATLAADCIKLGRAFGVILILATQRPDAASVPTGVSANVSIRLALRVMGQIENDLILGTSMYRNGVRATLFRPSDKGVGMLVGGRDEPTVLRTSYIDLPTSTQIGQRARALRLAAATLTGYAAGQWQPDHDSGPDYTLIADLLTVMPEDQAHSAVLCARLANAYPDRYDGWTPDTLATNLAPLGVRTRQTWAAGLDGERTNRQGLKRADLVTAAEKP
ncbi:MAG: cell division protein FtsK [Frankia sp.]|nr:cell division protein FtsK [Frankia sp.]